MLTQTLKQEISQLEADFCFALSDPTRILILYALSESPLNVTELTNELGITQPTTSRHLKVLETAQLITRARDAQWRRCRLDAAPLEEAAEWIERYRAFWEQRFDALAQYLAETAPRRRNRRRGRRARIK